MALGRKAILELLEEEHAAVWLEVEAKVADHAWHSLRRPVQPHHLTTARTQLRREGVIKESPGATRGGAAISVLHLADLRRRKKAFERAAARKRLLQARYLSWAVRRNLLGPAGERVAHASLVDVAPAAGYRLERPEGGPVASLFGAPVPGGPLDGAAHVQVTDMSGITRAVVTILVEVKNVREWIYPDSERLHQLLYKSARLKERHPDVPIVPVLVCRRASYMTFTMAKAFGFYVADAKAQFVPRRQDVTPTHVNEVALELGFSDLVQDLGPNRLLRKHFSSALPRVAPTAAQTWATYGPSYVQHFERLRDPRLSRKDRAAVAAELEQAVRAILAPEPGPTGVRQISANTPDGIEFVADSIHQRRCRGDSGPVERP